MNWKFWEKKPFEKIIDHSDWRAYHITEEKPLGEPAIFIPKKEHKQGKLPIVILDNQISTFKVVKNGVMIYRGLPIDRGTPFPVKVSICK